MKYMDEALVKLAAGVPFHDGVVSSISVDGSEVSIAYVIGDLQIGYRFVTVKYIDGHVSNETKCKSVVRDRRSEILASEFVYNNDGAWVHNLLFVPTGEFSITFRTLLIAEKSMKSRIIDYIGDPYSNEKTDARNRW
ncbi:hypothetical protein [Maricaulis sp.]|uniref:hypothetical protein n=1 Tax=Maricaulis sp. TaxID=1486257 RepID=UPI003A92674C